MIRWFVVDFRLASQAGDSLTETRIITPSTAGVNATVITQRQFSAVMGCQTANNAKSINPKLAVVPNKPEINGRDASGNASAARETPFGHTPPMPVHARNHRTSSCSGLLTK